MAVIPIMLAGVQVAINMLILGSVADRISVYKALTSK